MPQMSFMNWVFLYVYFLSIFYILMVKMYFFKPNV